ncbi:type II secretion system F family protein [Pseudomonas siliginis]|uniref:type II secretion system F family protein n=1 Tax=Pseudomonas siliginis TaxID=2842346 RepID=UPI002093F859|nr:type II secretion system F family protein [Pseudomonas siliginis]UST77202.1 type II secretion system F family protein [Pseudomonas siliginis]
MIKRVISTLDEMLTAARFSAEMRVDFYRSVALLLDNNVLLNDLLLELYNSYSDDGKKPNEPLAIIALECYQATSNGNKLSYALARWAPHQEVTLIAAGEQSGALVKALKDATKIIGFKQRIKSAVMRATLYPSFTYALAGVLLWVISTLLVPKLSKLSNPDTWEGAGYALSLISSAVTNGGAYMVIGILLLLVAIFYSLPKLKGELRIVLDRMPIYTTYRVLHGATFLLNVSVMVRAGIQLHDALLLLHKDAPPWLAERIGAAIMGTRQGGNLGVALHRAGHNFPDKRAVQYLKILASRQGFDEAIGNFAEDWLEQSITRVEKSASFSIVVSGAFVAGIMALVLLGTFDMQDAIDRSLSSKVH